MNTILNDKEIAEMCSGEDGRIMISPFRFKQVSSPSKGLSSFGYDLSLGTKFLVHKRHVAGYLDPLADNSSMFEEVIRYDTFFIQPHTQILAETVETFCIPDDIVSIVIGKSSYARLGLLVNCTPMEPGWNGKLTLELANLTPAPIVLHINGGIAQALFFRGNRPERTYAEKEINSGYQNQLGVTLPKISNSV